MLTSSSDSSMFSPCKIGSSYLAVLIAFCWWTILWKALRFISFTLRHLESKKW
jgi:hypothetical protein